MADSQTCYGRNTAADSFACVAVVIEVDTETGGVRLVEIVVADDLGRAINPLTFEGQIHGKITQGLGLALFKHPALDSGQFVNGYLADYTVPKAEGLPNFTSILVESNDRTAPSARKAAPNAP